MKKKRVASGLIALLITALPMSTLAMHSDGVDGNQGGLRVHGVLTASACRLEMASAWQDVDVGTLATSGLRRPGDSATPIQVTFHLQDCPDTLTRVRSALWSPTSSAITIHFTALTDDNNPTLVQVKGADGLALQLTDAVGRNVRFNDPGLPLLLTSGQTTLNYQLTPVRTTAPLRVGAWQALIGVGLSYD